MRPRIPDDKGIVSRTYGRFLELPVPIVLLALWVAGAVLIGFLGTLALHLLWLLL
jgi:hypothetical protein